MAPTSSSSHGNSNEESVTNTTHSLDLLCLLDSYDTAHGKGRDSQKAGQWKIGTARREKGGFHLIPSSSSISGLNVREELRARAVVAVCINDAEGNVDEPTLVDEDASGAAAKEVSTGSDKGNLFTLYPDGMPTSSRDKDTAGNDNTSASHIGMDGDKSASDTSSGLRQRKNAPRGAKPNAEKGEWSEEIPAAVLTEEEMEEEKLRNANPLDLFGGLPPPSLRAAQAKAKEALASYVDAANFAAEIIRITNEAELAKQKEEKTATV